MPFEANVEGLKCLSHRDAHPAEGGLLLRWSHASASSSAVTPASASPVSRTSRRVSEAGRLAAQRVRLFDASGFAANGFNSKAAWFRV
jgi:hypothetical protein